MTLELSTLPALLTHTSRPGQKRKLCYLYDGDEDSRDHKFPRSQPSFRTNPLELIEEGYSLWEFDVSEQMRGFNNYFDSFVQCDFLSYKLATVSGVQLKKVQLEDWISSSENCNFDPDTTWEKLEAERYPGFSLLPIAQQLDFVADALLLKFPHHDTFKLLTLFNLVNHYRGAMMINSNACGHNLCVKRLLERLTQLQRLLGSTNTVPTFTMLQFQADAFHMLGLLSRSNCGRDCILKEGGLRTIVDQIKRRPCDKVTMRYCCFALGNLVNSMSDDTEGTFKKMVEREKIIQLLLQFMREHEEDWQVVQQICFAIGNIAYIEDFEDLIVREGAIQLVLSLMQKHASHSPLLTDAIFFLKNFAVGEVGRALILSNEGIKSILETMKNHDSQVELLELAINVLFDLTFSGGVETLMRDSRGIELILLAIKMHENEDLLKEALRALTRIYCNCTDEQKIMVIKARTIDVLRELKNRKTTSTLLVNQIHDIFGFAQDTVTHQKKPQNSTPTFPELCARVAINKKVHMPGDDFVPIELKRYLASHKICSFCNQSFFEHYYETVQYRTFKEYPHPLPSFMTLCSEKCFQTVQNNLLLSQ